MSVPSKPIRKAARTGNDNLGRPTSSSVPGASAYKRKTASKSDASKSTYTRKPAGISPTTHDIHRTAGDASQPRNNPSASGYAKGNGNFSGGSTKRTSSSKKMNGVD